MPFLINQCSLSCRKF